VITVRIVRSTADFSALEQSWSDLLQEGMREDSIFQTFEWNSVWWKHIGTLSYKLSILVAEVDHRVVGIMPLVYKTAGIYPLSLRRFEFLGRNISNYQNFILEESRRSGILSALLECLLRIMRPFDYALLDNLPRSSAFWLQSAAVKGSLNEKSVSILRGEASWIVEIKRAWPEYLLRNVKKKFRYDVQRQIRRLDEQSRLEFLPVNREKAVDLSLGKLFKMKIVDRKAKGERRSNYENPNFLTFLKEVSSIFLKKGWLYMHQLRLDRAAVAINCNFQYGRRIYCHSIAFDINFDRKFSPGRILQFFELEKAHEGGFELFDFGRGEAYYKKQWCNKKAHTMRAFIIKNPLLMVILTKALPVLRGIYRRKLSNRLRRRVKEMIMR